MDTFTHEVQDQDTLISISLKYNISLYALLRLNNLSEDSILYPGMNLKIETLNTSQPISSPNFEIQQDLNKMKVAYCSLKGDIKGTLVYNEYSLNFIPESINSFNTLIKTFDGISEVEAIDYFQFIDHRDVLSVSVVQYPGFDMNQRADDQLFIKIIVRKTGFEPAEQNKNTPKGTVYFKIYSEGSSRNLAQFQLLKEYAEAFLAALLMTIRRINYIAGPTETLITFCMRSDHPLILLRQQHGIYYKTLINWDIYQTQALESALTLGTSLSNSPLKTFIDPEQRNLVSSESILPSMSTPSNILSELMVKQIVEKLPDFLKYRDWDLVYRPDKHGWSLNTFYRNCENYGSNVLVIKDDGNSIFGGYANTSWVHSRRYYGDGECFLFTFGHGQEIKAFLATLENNYYMSSDDQSIIMGGGKNSGIFIDKDLSQGQSGFSETFSNEVLSSSENFYILDMEVWGLV